MYKFDSLRRGKFLKRYKRFFADIEYNGEVLTAHNPNTGSMKMLLNACAPALFSESDNPKRKLKYTLEALMVEGHWALVNTIRVNTFVKKALEDGEIQGLGTISYIKSEYKYGDSRIDFYVESDTGKHLIEVKNTTLFDDTHCMFPDAVTERGRKHLVCLQKSIEDGYTPHNMYICQVPRNKFRCASEIDEKYCREMQTAKEAGVDFMVYKTVFDEDEGAVRLSPL